MKGEQMMMTNEKMKINGCTPIEDLITEDFGAIGPPKEMNSSEDAKPLSYGTKNKFHDLVILTGKHGNISYNSRNVFRLHCP
ncbi:hypothetical protein [Bacteroides thetaiotaomicron]|uniref:hypothetical protein n=1 Tax=Bacteroides thetaiotaomicron TaxID=818 RepID=UPI0021641988|nr:hypothetical protein [Bacteroides thetaiotaomicron]MCS2261526.1 hypothetical protein [Bacteroides thetaiotaomicron]MCS2293664.1 hypothetical protein [Bacteroides thetaiotaomicron]MCS3044122.1 hypothetical protein [Bacteroides thetaiotaomicron]UVQ27026.1 hypothetical protein NXW82_25045 [Bacteroides thetaiotaomicron]